MCKCVCVLFFRTNIFFCSHLEVKARISNIEHVVRIKINIMFKILWFILLVSSTCTADLLDIFRSPLRTLNSFLSIEMIDESVNQDIKLTTVT